MNARLIGETGEGMELRYAASPSDTWPGYDASCPLGEAGYWLGTHRKHWHITTDRRTAVSYLRYWGEGKATLTP